MTLFRAREPSWLLDIAPRLLGVGVGSGGAVTIDEPGGRTATVTPIHFTCCPYYASLPLRLRLLRLLLEGADAGRLNEVCGGLTPLQRARLHGERDVVELLLAAGAQERDSEQAGAEDGAGAGASSSLSSSSSSSSAGAAKRGRDDSEADADGGGAAPAGSKRQVGRE